MDLSKYVQDEPEGPIVPGGKGELEILGLCNEASLLWSRNFAPYFPGSFKP